MSQLRCGLPKLISTGGPRRLQKSTPHSCCLLSSNTVFHRMTRLFRDPDHGALQPLLVRSRFDCVTISFGSVSSRMLLLGDGGTRLPICVHVCATLSQLVRSSRTFSCRWWSAEGGSQRLGGHAQERRILRIRREFLGVVTAAD